MAVKIVYVLKFRRILDRNPISLAGKIFSIRTLMLLFFGWEDYMPELREIGLDPAVQGVPVKKKLSVDDDRTTRCVFLPHCEPDCELTANS